MHSSCSAPPWRMAVSIHCKIRCICAAQLWRDCCEAAKPWRRAKKKPARKCWLKQLRLQETTCRESRLTIARFACEIDATVTHSGRKLCASVRCQLNRLNRRRFGFGSPAAVAANMTDRGSIAYVVAQFRTRQGCYANTQTTYESRRRG